MLQFNLVMAPGNHHNKVDSSMTDMHTISILSDLLIFLPAVPSSTTSFTPPSHPPLLLSLASATGYSVDYSTPPSGASTWSASNQAASSSYSQDYTAQQQYPQRFRPGSLVMYQADCVHPGSETGVQLGTIGQVYTDPMTGTSRWVTDLCVGMGLGNPRLDAASPRIHRTGVKTLPDKV